jgi:hypothetical protein
VGNRTMDLPLEAQFRLRAIQSDINSITDLGKAKELLYKCFEHQISYEYLVKQLFKQMSEQDLPKFKDQLPDPKEKQDG